MTDERLWDLWNSQGSDYMSQTEALGFARSIEAEVLAQDAALIRQLVEALECCMDDVSDKLAQLEGASFNDTPELYAQEQIVEIANNAITAARARLTEKGGPNVP